MSTTRVQIGPADAGRAMTLDEFREADEEPGYLYELARGILEVVEVPGDAHGQIVHNINVLFTRYLLRHPGPILRIAHGSDLRLIATEPDTDRHPDLAVVFRGAARNARGRQLPRLVVEVVSPGAKARKRDYQDKADDYLRIGIEEYWVVDPDPRRLTVHVRRADGDRAHWDQRTFEHDQAVESELLPDFRATVADFWAHVDAEENPEADA